MNPILLESLLKYMNPFRAPFVPKDWEGFWTHHVITDQDRGFQYLGPSFGSLVSSFNHAKPETLGSAGRVANPKP